MMEAKLQEIANDVNVNRKGHADTLTKLKQHLNNQARNDHAFGIRNLPVYELN